MTKKIKKQICVGLSAMGLAAVMIFGMTGCAGTSGSDSKGTSENNSESTSENNSESTSENNSNSTDDITIEAIVEANSRDSVLSRHDSVLNDLEGDYMMTTEIYVSPDYGYERMADGTQRLVDADGHSWQYVDVDGSMYLAYEWFIMDDEEAEEVGHITLDDFSDPVITADTTAKETIEDIKDNGDGTLTVTTLVKAEDTAQFYKSESEKFENLEYPEEYYTCDKKCVYIIDQDSLEIASCEEFLLTEDEDEFVCRFTLTYDAEPSGDLADMIALAEEFDSGKQEEPKNITFIYDYGTDSEETYTLATDQKFQVFMVLKDGYDEIYDDPEGQKVHESGNRDSDVTLYAFKAE